MFSARGCRWPGSIAFLWETSAIAKPWAKACLKWGSTGGPGYRVYYALAGKGCCCCFVAATGKQASDIRRAPEHLKD